MRAIEGHDKKSNYVITSIIKPNTWEDTSLFFNHSQPINIVKTQAQICPCRLDMEKCKHEGAHTYCNGSQSQKQ